MTSHKAELEVWEVTLDAEGGWHCYCLPSGSICTFEILVRSHSYLGRGIVSRWIIEAYTRSQALSVAKRNYRGNLKEGEININCALPTMEGG